MMKAMLGGLAGLGLVAGLAAPADAAAIRLDFTAEVEHMLDTDGYYGFSVGDTVSGYLVLDADTAPVLTGLATRYHDAITAFVVDGKGVEYPSWADSEVTVIDDGQAPPGVYHDRAAYTVESHGFGPGWVKASSFSISAYDVGLGPSDVVTGTGLDALATSADVTAYHLTMNRLDKQAGHHFAAGFVKAGLLSVSATYDVAPVPVPAALPLFAAALAGLGGMGWWRRAASGPA